MKERKESNSSEKQALNATQKNIIEGMLTYNLQAIEDQPPSEAIKGLRAIFAESITDIDELRWKDQGIWDSIKQVRDIFSHPCPQNRSEGSPYVGQIPGYAVWNDGKGIEKEPLGLLSLTARNDDTAPPVTKEAVVSYICSLVDGAIKEIENKLQKNPVSESSNPTFTIEFIIENSLGKKTLLELKPTESITEVKNHYLEKRNIPTVMSNRLSLFFHGKKLDENKKVSDYALQDTSLEHKIKAKGHGI